ncbi:cytochrome c oxidase assembly protein [Acidimangrovimonas sediminis]|uniref:cytochrome c oxidase assembly protein n=1 Tax=Acidimangrovimonas sediminis TaxID=2056283 RepID=UPI000C80F67F|nr:cytochrome c oxidase assembly protein [Acidimangrovimonas sediminis]
MRILLILGAVLAPRVAVAAATVAAPGGVPDGIPAGFWGFNPVIVGALALVAWTYMQGVERLERRGRPVAWGRQAAVYAGLLTLWAALQSPLASWAGDSFEGQAWQGFALRLLGPLLFFLGTPQSALIAGLPRWGRRALARRLPHRGRIRRGLRAAARPVPATLGLILGLGVWCLPAMQAVSGQAVAGQAVGGTLMQATWLASGLLFFATLFHPQDAPHGPPHARRQAMLIAAALAQLLIGAALTMKPMLLYRFGRGLGDEAAGGYVIWTPSCFLLLAAILIVVHQWNAAEERRWARAQRGGLSNAEMMALMPQTAEELRLAVAPRNRRTAYGLGLIPLLMFVTLFATVETVRMIG